MSNSRFIALAAAVVAGLAIVAPAEAQRDRDGQQRWIDVVNRANVQIREFYMTDVGTQNWGDDRLGRDVVEPGQQMRVLPTANQRARGFCRYDMKVVFSNGAEVVRNNVNLCETAQLVCSSTRACAAR